LQAGTPVVRAHGAWDESAGVYALTLTQSQRAFPGEPAPLPLPIPVRVGLLGADGKDIAGAARTLELTEAEQTFTFEGVRERPVASIARGFSAPIKVEAERSHEELAFLMLQPLGSQPGFGQACLARARRASPRRRVPRAR
jgi:aminopeptidase N